MVESVMWSVIVHGGAGAIPGPLEVQHRAGCEAAVAEAARWLKRGANALEAACAAVRVLEDDPAFNAGRGAALDARGVPALDAAVMRGDQAYGAAAAVVGVKHPVDLARAILEDGRHCLLVGEGALAFARSAAIELVAPDYHVTEEARRALAHRLTEIEAGHKSDRDWQPSQGNTVGAVVRDSYGHLAAATSTGGLVGRYPGRVGDSPIAGAGTFASDALGAISATGHGETMMRTVFAHHVALRLSKYDLAGTLSEALEMARGIGGGRGGLIVIRPDGELAFARNTAAMGVAWQKEDHPIQSAF